MTEITIAIPTPLRAFSGNQKRVIVNAFSIDNALDQLIKKYPILESHLFDSGRLRNFVNIYLNDEDIRYLSEIEVSNLKSGDTLSIIPSIAGGK